MKSEGVWWSRKAVLRAYIDFFGAVLFELWAEIKDIVKLANLNSLVSEELHVVPYEVLLVGALFVVLTELHLGDL